MPLELNLSPVNSEIAELLASHVTGHYRVVSHSWSKYVCVSPASDQPITVRSSAMLHVYGGARTFKGKDDVLTFVIMFDERGTTLMDVGFKTGKRRAKASAPEFVVCDHGPVAEGQAPGEPQPKRVRKPMTLVTAPDPVPPPARVNQSVPAPPWAEKIRAHEQMETDLGDYLVIPAKQVKKDPLPAWVVPSAHVTAMHVVKPRLGEDREI